MSLSIFFIFVPISSKNHSFHTMVLANISREAETTTIVCPSFYATQFYLVLLSNNFIDFIQRIFICYFNKTPCFIPLKYQENRYCFAVSFAIILSLYENNIGESTKSPSTNLLYPTANLINSNKLITLSNRTIKIKYS